MRKLKFENVNLAVNTSIKVHIYNQLDQCYGIGWHLHPEYELVYIRNGNGLLNIDKRSVPYQDGVLLFLGPDIPHTDFGNSDHRNALEVVVQFSEDFVRDKLGVFPELAAIRKLVQRSKNVLIFDDEIRRSLDAEFAAMAFQSSTNRLVSFLAILSRLSQPDAATELFPGANIPTITKPADAQRLESVFARVNRDYGMELSTSMMAAEIGMTTNSFCRFFKAHTDKTFTAFLNGYRLGRARDLLLHTDTPIQEVMYATGFRDGPYFSRAFKRAVGCSPSTLRGRRARPQVLAKTVE